MRQRGFTLVELLVVIAIIGLLATVGVVSLNQARAKARDAKRLSDVKQISKALELYLSGPQQYPVGLNDPALVLDGGCLSEKKGLQAAAACALTAADNILINPIAKSPNISSSDFYNYRAYLEQNPPTTGNGTACTAVTANPTCLSYGIQFSLETSVSGLSAGAHCMTATGIFKDPASPAPCPAAP